MVLLVFNLHLSRQFGQVAETYYELEPEPKVEKEQNLEGLENTPPSNSKSTNLAYNETKKYNEIDDNYLNKVREHYNKYAKATQATQNADNIKDDYTSENLSAYNEINSLLSAKNKNLESHQSNGKNRSEEISISQGANKNSTMSYSLVGRTHKFLPTPIYLCETSGIIVISITVNPFGTVTTATVNGASTSNNQCLIEHALEYANKARFSNDNSKKTQLGTITFKFVGKD